MVRTHTPEIVQDKNYKTGRPQLLAARSRRLNLKPHHTKAYRKRHLGLLAVVGLFFFVTVLQSGILIGQATTPAAQTVEQQPIIMKPSASALKSSYGFAMEVDRNQFAIIASAVDEKGIARTLPSSEYASNAAVNSVVITPEPSSLPARLSATRLSLQIGTDTAAFTRLKSRSPSVANEELAKEMLPVTRPSNFDMRVVSDLPETLNGVTTRKTVYQYTPLFKGGVSYGVSWHGIVNGYPFIVQLQGLVGSSEVPAELRPLLDGLNLGATSQVQGVTTTASVAYAADNLEQKYVSDAVSPAVVKIYHLVCGQLVVNGANFEEGCDGTTGSGFIASANGYIATNGHVVVRGAKDVFVGTLTSNQPLLIEYLRVMGLSFNEISSISQRPELLASVIAKVYDVPDNQIFFKNKQEATLVALGTTPVELKSLDDARKLFNFKDTNAIKNAQIIAVDYNAKDQYSVVASPEAGFTASDVALLKINVTNAPVIPIETGTITQNQKIIVMGYPGDADNSLTDNSKLGLSVTNGAVSSIRDAAGGKSVLYQSDADASQGSSGGPALTEEGAVFGLLTYRIDSQQSGSAAKSYIRAIGDLIKLADSKDVTFDTASTTQAAWQRGLEFYAQNRYTRALGEFQLVQEQYPSHRLAGTYIANANRAIAEGRDIKDAPVAFLFIAGGASFLLLALVIFAIIMHFGKHQRYKHAVGNGEINYDPGTGVFNVPQAVATTQFVRPMSLPELAKGSASSGPNPRQPLKHA